MWKWMKMTIKYQTVSQYSVGLNVGRCLVLFYADDVMVGAQDSEWLQNALNFIIGLFWRYRLFANVTKSQTITFQPGALWSGMPDEAVGRLCKSLGVSYREQL